MLLRQKLISSFRTKFREKDFWFSVLLFSSLALIFWPLTQWLSQTAHDQSRILNALIILVLAVFSLVYFNRIIVKEPLTLNSHARNNLLLAYFCLLLAFLIGRFTEPSSLRNFALSSCSIFAYCSALSAFILFVFGVGLRRITYTACGTFAVFIILSTFMGILDWPLRTLAAKWSSIPLQLIGKSVELGISGNPQVAPKLILFVDNYPFHVASECNGFGVILTSLLLGLMLGLYQKLNPLRLPLNLVTALIIGFCFNSLRIVLIVILAPHMMDYYDFMHEVVGAVTFWACLISVWMLHGGPTQSAKEEPV